MNDMKCPFCQQELEIIDLDVQLLGCENQNCKHSIHYDTVGTKELWQELIDSMKEHDLCHDALVKQTKELDRTERALDVAKDALKRILNHATAIDTARCRAEMALNEITELEQKDVK